MTLLTDEAVEAVREHFPDDERSLRILLAAFIAHHEGERPCERCAPRGWVAGGSERGPGGMGTRVCPDCGGTGKVRKDRLVKLSDVVALLRGQDEQDAEGFDSYHKPSDLADFIEREFGGDR